MRSWRPWALAGVLLVAAMRLPWLAVAFSNDEGGYAYVARYWSVGSGGIYGGQWIDRPPLLLALYAAALHVAGDLGVRVLGLTAAAFCVVMCVFVAHSFGGEAAARRSAVLAALLLASPLLGAQAVNAELLAVAFVTTSMASTVRAVRSSSPARWSILAGLTGIAAVLVKQSFVDAVLFAAVLLAATARTSPHRRWHLVLCAMAGACGAGMGLLACAAWAEAFGPGTHALVEALYGFRVEAGKLLAAASDASHERAPLFVGAAVASGIAGLLIASVGRRPITPEQTALSVLGIWGVAAIVLGGSWWPHYLVQLVPVLAIGGACASTRWATVARWHVAVALPVIWLVLLCYQTVEHERPDDDVLVGAWLASRSRPGDTVIVAWGSPDVLYRSGMRSPYPLSWSLPVRVRDQSLTNASMVLRGPQAPTWFVAWSNPDRWQLDDSDLQIALRARYEVAGHPAGRTVYRLRNG